MIFFKKKNGVNKVNKEGVEEEKDLIVKGSSYNIIIKEDLGDSLRRVTTFKAERWVDKENFLVYLRNEKRNFLELLPKREKEILDLDKKDLESRVKKIREKLKEVEKGVNPDKINKNNIKFDLMRYEAQLRAIEWGKCAFLEFGENGEKELTFIRDGTNMFPVGYDATRKLYGVPDDIRKKPLYFLMRNKENKYSKHQKLISGATFGVIAIACIMFIISCFMLFKAYDLYSSHEVNEAKLQSLSVANACSNIALNNANAVNDIYKTIKNELNKSQTVITGIQPQEISR